VLLKISHLLLHRSTICKVHLQTIDGDKVSLAFDLGIISRHVFPTSSLGRKFWTRHQISFHEITKKFTHRLIRKA